MRRGSRLQQVEEGGDLRLPPCSEPEWGQHVPGGGQILERTALSVQRGWSVVWVATASVHRMKPGLPQKPHGKSKSEGRGSLGFGMPTAGVALTRLAWGTV